MSLRIPLFFLLLVSLSSCAKERFIINNEQYIIFGSYAGECIGPQCVQLYRLTSSELFEGIDETYPVSIPYNGDFQRLPTETYEAIKDLVDAIPERLINADSQTFGCPDCADQGGYYLEYYTPQEVKAWFIDTNENALPEYLTEMAQVLNEKLIFLRD